MSPTPLVAPLTLATPRRRPLAATVRGALAGAAAVGVGIECAYGSVPTVLSYFTIWTNILVAVVFGVSAARAARGRPDLSPALRGGVLLFILVTGLVFHLVLDNPASPYNVTAAIDGLTGPKAVANQLLHTVTPIGAALDFLLLTPARRLRPRHAALWLAYPAAYLGFALTRGALLAPDSPNRYPYPFVDVTRYGYGSVLVNALVLGAGFLLLGLLLTTADRFRPAVSLPGNRISSPAEGRLQ
ncbi:Pr6Pr family membrane protein [Streptomyces sp. BI20]|uniref:Pr6Pr family membrane protein n=1 Tax=Streptomyces sp. BI20 TaxID=3403460 RepID=UPI003C778090